MSLSKLESLPNEILSDLIEKYINGMDVLMAFNYQLNRRFDALITQCHQLYFNFIQCQKDDFRFCIGLLPAYVDKIEELAISEHDAPGQVHAFLSFFPSFKSFKRLRKLYFHYNVKTVDQNMVRGALYSLAHTTIDTLSIKITSPQNQSILNEYLVHLLRSKTLKRFCFSCDSNDIEWEYLTSISSDIEYLTLVGIHCELSCLVSISQWAPRLKYLDIGLFDVTRSFSYQSGQSSVKNIRPMLALRTLILSFEERDQRTLDRLAPYLNAMPVLNHLEINGNSTLVNAGAWEMFLERSLPLLTHLTLRMSIIRVEDVDIDNVQASFQSPFWIAKKNFNIIITKHRGYSNINDLGVCSRQKRNQYNQYDFHLPIYRCLIAPNRSVNNSFINVDQITSLRLFDGSDIELSHYYFNNIKCLTVDKMSRPLFNWMTTYVNCSRIKELTITRLYEKTDDFASLVACVSKVNSLHISFKLLMANKGAFTEKNRCLKRLDISVSEHVFDQKSIIIIAKLFPYLEHIQINTKDLYNIPILKVHLPHLRSLFFCITIPIFNLDDENRYAYDLRQKTKFLFQVEENFINIWIDQAVYEESYWQTFIVKSPQSKATSIITSDDNKKKKPKFSLFKFFKK
jgi:hypothetical protein